MQPEGICPVRFLFPYVSSGPIVNAQEMLPQYRQIGRQRLDWAKFSGGLYLFALGLSKKVLLADTFGKAVDAGYGNVAGLSGTDAWLVMLFYTLQLYFDFSGYCDMGRGIAHMLGMELPVNFDSPYKASNIIEFWKHWHITLNRFLRKYVYIPLGGNRKGTARMYLNLFIVFLVSGIWHGAGWNFVLWGALPWCAVSGYSGMAAKAATAAVCGGCACSKWNEKIRRTFCSPTCALRRSDLPVFELYMDAVPFCKSVTGR